MEKNNITPISCYSDSLVYEELNKEELKEAGVVIDYVGDEVVDCDIYKDYDNKKRRSWFKYLMFLFLVLHLLYLDFVILLLDFPYGNSFHLIYLV